MFYPQELIEEIRIQNDIVDVVGEYMPLKQKGNSYFGLCPFHNERTPSFSVNPDKQFYYCFGCGEGGNAYSFVMQMENCDFVEAVQKLADRVHITLPEPEYSSQAMELEKLRQTLFEVQKVAGRFYYDTLHSEQGGQALTYLSNRRVGSGTQNKFGLGLATTARDGLYKFLTSKGYSQDILLKSGLVLQSKDGRSVYDRFRDRLMFPIFDVQGRVIGFGGRMLGNGEPKYLNSPETILFNKSKTLYGLNFARAAKKREMIIVEGYMDMISVYQAGFQNVVAGLGTAFNPEHARLLKKYADEVILLYDSDDAGTKAALRAIPILTNNGVRVKVLQVTGAKDADEYIKKYGAKAFGKLIIDAVSHITFQVECIRKNYNLENTEHKVLFTRKAAEVLAALESDIECSAYTKEIAQYTGIEENAIKNEIGHIRSKKESEFMKSAEQKKVRAYPQKIDVTKGSKGILEAQRDILYLCAVNSTICKKVKNIVQPNEFDRGAYQKLAELIYDAHDRNVEILPAELMNYFSDLEDQKLVTQTFAVKNSFENLKACEKAVNEEIKFIKKTYYDKLAASASTVEDIKKLIDGKKKLDELYITITDG